MEFRSVYILIRGVDFSLRGRKTPSLFSCFDSIGGTLRRKILLTNQKLRPQNSRRRIAHPDVCEMLGDESMAGPLDQGALSKYYGPPRRAVRPRTRVGVASLRLVPNLAGQECENLPWMNS